MTLRLNVTLTKSTNIKPGFKRGTLHKEKCVPIRMINVIPVHKTNQNINSKNDILKVIPWADTFSMLKVDENKYVRVNSKLLKNKFKISSTRDIVIKLCENSSIPFDAFDGNHYFINIQN
jgi:hypothetical protein